MVNEELISNTDNKILYLVFGFPTLVLIGFFIYSMMTGPGTQELIKADNLAENFAGRVDSLYFDQKNHNIKYAVFQDEQKVPVLRIWERYIEVGDSLSKQQGSFVWEVYKKNGSKMVLDYRDTYKKGK